MLYSCTHMATVGIKGLIPYHCIYFQLPILFLYQRSLPRRAVVWYRLVAR